MSVSINNGTVDERQQLSGQQKEEEEEDSRLQNNKDRDLNRVSDEEFMDTDETAPRDDGPLNFEVPRTRKPKQSQKPVSRHREAAEPHSHSVKSTRQQPSVDPNLKKREKAVVKSPSSDPTAYSDDETESPQDVQQQASAPTGRVVSQSIQPTRRRGSLSVLHWAVLFGITIFIIVTEYKQLPEPETVRGHSKIMEQLLVIPKMSQLLDDWKEKETEDNTMSILVTGKTGVGKSTLINGIIGKRVIPVEDNVLKPATEDVEAFNLKIGEVEIQVWDTHGFQEVAGGDEKKYLEDMKHNCEKVDLVLYCLRMDDTRMRPGDTHAVRQLTKTFGKSIWDHALFVLTFANRVEPPKKKDRHKLEEYFNEKLEAWVGMLGVVLKDNGVTMDAETVRRKVVPAGYEEAHLPRRKFWLSDLWLSAFHESSSHAKPLLLAINNDRMTDEEQVVS